MRYHDSCFVFNYDWNTGVIADGRCSVRHVEKYGHDGMFHNRMA